LYAAKASRFSYITPAGPDVVNLNLSANSVPAGTMVDITAEMNDTRYNGAEPAQNIVAAEYYLDVPPWITTTTPISVPLTAVDGTFNSPIEAVAGTIDTSTLSNGQHLIFVRGLDAAGNWGAISSVFLNVLQPATAVFNHPSPIATGMSVTFTNQSIGVNLSYLWDLGDGTTSTTVNPTHSYSQAMSYTVTLTATNNLGIDVATSVIEVMDVATAVFSHTSPIATGTPLTFTNQSIGTDLSYLWDFGDGTTSSDLTPTHVFTQAGAYTVTLTAQNAVSSDSVSSIVVVMDVPVAQFSSMATAPVGSTLAFTNLSTGTDLSYLWDFGDGTTSPDINPSHSFSQTGSYTITLTAVNAVGADEVTAVIDITEATVHIYLPFINRND
jgi:PKD repeat protein